MSLVAASALMIVLPVADAWSVATGMRAHSMKPAVAAGINMKIAPVAAPVPVAPPPAEPEGIFDSITGLFDGIDLSFIADLDLTVAAPVVGALGLGAVALVALSPPSDEQLKAKMGNAFTAGDVTPTMALALADARYKTTLGYKLIDPIKAKIGDIKDEADRKSKLAKKAAEAAKAAKEAEAKRAADITDGRLIELDLPGGLISGLVVPSPTALAKDTAGAAAAKAKDAAEQAKELLPFGKE